MYVLLGMTDYESDTLLGLYSTLESAEESYKSDLAQGFDNARIIEVPVDAPPTDYFL